MAVVTAGIGPLVAAALDRLDRDAVARAYAAQDEMVVVDAFFTPEEVREHFGDGLARARPRRHRAGIPGFKRSGSVSVYTLREHAPEFLALYESPSFLGFVRDLVGAAVAPCPPSDPHACALYVYERPGDRIGYHYDTSHYRGRRFTVLLGLVQRSESCKLVAELHRGTPSARHVEVPTPPGLMVIFNGDRLWHAVTPLAPGEERVVLTMEYVTDAAMAPHRRALSSLKDAFVYFGVRSLVRRA